MHARAHRSTERAHRLPKLKMHASAIQCATMLVFGASVLAAPPGPPPSPPPDNTPPAPCEGCRAVFYRGLAGKACFRVPSIIKTSHGTLLAFAEKRAPDCGDDYFDTAIVARRSSDRGKSWGPLITVRAGSPPCDGCPAAISNANPVEVRQADGSMAIMLHYDTMNNPGPKRHGLDMQLWSLDDGRTWIEPTVLTYPPQQNVGAMIGPAVGIQAKSGRIYFSAHLAYTYWTGVGWKGDSSDVAFLYWSDDYGVTWRSSPSLSGLNECTIAFLVDAADGRVLMNCRIGPGKPRKQVVWTDGIPGPVQPVPSLTDPGCQGSLVNSGGVLHLSNANHKHSRHNMTVKTSVDGGRTWSSGVSVHKGPSAYSQLVVLNEKTQRLGLLFESGVHYYNEMISFATVHADVPAAAPAPPDSSTSHLPGSAPAASHVMAPAGARGAPAPPKSPTSATRRAPKSSHLPGRVPAVRHEAMAAPPKSSISHKPGWLADSGDSLPAPGHGGATGGIGAAILTGVGEGAALAGVVALLAPALYCLGQQLRLRRQRSFRRMVKDRARGGDANTGANSTELAAAKSRKCARESRIVEPVDASHRY